VDARAKTLEHAVMESTVTRPELHAKFGTIEARVDTRVARIEGKIDQLMIRLDNTDHVVGKLRWWVLGAALSILAANFGTAFGIQQMSITNFQAAAAQYQAPPPARTAPAS
jgi:translation initiation factor IF-1